MQDPIRGLDQPLQRGFLTAQGRAGDGLARDGRSGMTTVPHRAAAPGHWTARPAWSRQRRPDQFN